MRILILNGSPKKDGNTAIALHEMEKVFAEEGIETEIVQVGSKPIRGCIACGQCAKVCPQNLIKIHDCANYIVVKCSNKEKGAVARKQCEVSCIGCGICEKTCTAGAIHVEDNCAVIQEDICLSCGMCSVKCPRHVIHDLRGVFTAVR